MVLVGGRPTMFLHCAEKRTTCPCRSHSHKPSLMLDSRSAKRASLCCSALSVRDPIGGVVPDEHHASTIGTIFTCRIAAPAAAGSINRSTPGSLPPAIATPTALATEVSASIGTAPVRERPIACSREHLSMRSSAAFHIVTRPFMSMTQTPSSSDSITASRCSES